MKNAGAEVWYGLFASAKVPQDIIKRLNAATVKVLADPEVKERLARVGAEPFESTSDEFNSLLRREFNDYEQLVKTIGAKTE